jgi:hypothetical protein
VVKETLVLQQGEEVGGGSEGDTATTAGEEVVKLAQVLL